MATRLKSSFPDLDWPDQAIISVDAGDASAVITSLVIHLSQDVPAEILKAANVTPLFAYADEAPGLSR